MKIHLIRFALILGTFLLGSLGSANAQTYNWTPTAGGNYDWDLAANWTGDPGFPNANTATANLSANLTGNQVIAASGSYVVNALTLGDDTHSYTVQFGGTNSLTFNQNGGTAPTIAMTGTVSQFIDTALVIGASQLTVTQNSFGTALTLSKTISGSGRLIVDGFSNVTLSAANTYTGGTTIALGNLYLGATNALSTGGVTLNGGFLRTQGFAQTTGALTLSDDTTIILGAGDHSLTFSGLAATPAATSDLLITGYVGNGTGGRIYFNSNANFNATFLSHITFSGGFPAGAVLRDAGGGQYELVPAPEPTTVLGIATLGLAGLAGLRRLRRRPAPVAA